MPGHPPSPLIAGADPSRGLDLLLVNAPLRDYSQRPRVNDFTLPVLGMAYTLIPGDRVDEAAVRQALAAGTTRAAMLRTARGRERV